MKKIATNLLSLFKLDIFHHKFFFRIGKDNNNSTYFSILITYLVLTPLSIYFIVMLISIFNHSTAKINSQDLDITKRPLVTLKKESFQLGFKIMTYNGEVINDTAVLNYLDIGVTHRSFNRKSLQWTPYKYFSLRACNESDFASEFNDFYQLNLINAICIKDFNFSMQGYWDEDNVEFSIIEIRPCNQAVSDNKCMDMERIKEKLQYSYFYFYIQGEDADSNQYYNPIKKTMKTFFYQMDFLLQKQIYLSFKNVELLTNDGIFYNYNANEENYAKFADISVDVSTFNTSSMTYDGTNSATLISLLFFSSNTKQTIERTYPTILDVIADVGGISKFILVLGSIITLFFNEMKLTSKLLNEVYFFDLTDDAITSSKIKAKSIELFPINTRKLKKYQKSQEEDKESPKLIENFDLNISSIKDENVQVKEVQKINNHHNSYYFEENNNKI